MRILYSYLGVLIKVACFLAMVSSVSTARAVSLGEALDATNLTWTTSGDAVWFGETTNSYDGNSAAQSGTMQDDQSSTLQTTIVGPGTITFYWETVGQDDEFDLEFDLNGVYKDDITAQTGWRQDTFELLAGTNVLTWIATSGDGSSPGDAGFVDEFVFIPPPPFIPGTWTLTSNLVSATYGEQLVLLTNGMALAYEGATNGLPRSLSEIVQLFDPVAGTWAAASNALAYRIGGLAATLQSGGVLACGGAGLTNSEVYFGSPPQWSFVGSMFDPHYGGTLTALPNGKALAVGGDDINGDPTADAELYNPLTGLWSPAPPLANSRTGHTATLLTNGLVLIANGVDVEENYQLTCYLYNPLANAWTPTGSMINPRAGATATLLANGKVLVAGGFDHTFQYQTSAELYDPVSGTWSSAGNMAVARGNHVASLLPNGMALLAGGGNFSGATATAEIYDPTAGTWDPTSPMNTNRSQSAAVRLNDGRVLVVGGYNGATTFPTAETFSLTTSNKAAAILITRAAKLSNGTFQLGFTNIAGSTNEIFASTNAAAPLMSWVSLGTATENPSGTFTFTDSTATNASRRFYRVRSP